MVYKILIDNEAIFDLFQLYPCRFNICRAVTFLQENNVADHIGASISAESVVG